MTAALRNLTLASAKHLVSQGHISGAMHKKIVKKVGGSMKKPPAMKSMASMADETPPGAFGSLNPLAGAGAGHYMGSMPTGGASEEGQ